MNAIVELFEFRDLVKKNICKVLVDMYMIENNNQLPNWEEDEEIVIDDSKLHTQTILLEVFTQSGDVYEKQVINEYRVTLDDNLFFRCGDDEIENEINWCDVSTDDLVSILDMLSLMLNNMKKQNK